MINFRFICRYAIEINIISKIGDDIIFNDRKKLIFNSYNLDSKRSEFKRRKKLDVRCKKAVVEGDLHSP